MQSSADMIMSVATDCIPAMTRGPSSIVVAFKVAQLVSSFRRRVKAGVLSRRSSLRPAKVQDELCQAYEKEAAHEIHRLLDRAPVHAKCVDPPLAKANDVALRDWDDFEETPDHVEKEPNWHASFASLMYQLEKQLQAERTSLTTVAKDNNILLQYHGQINFQKYSQRELTSLLLTIEHLLASISYARHNVFVDDSYLCTGNELVMRDQFDGQLDDSGHCLGNDLDFDCISLANLEYLLLVLQTQLVRELFKHGWSLLEKHVIEWQREQAIRRQDYFCEFPDGRHPLSTTWPWSIKPSLAVIWGVCWMFIYGNDYCDPDGNLRDFEGKIMLTRAELRELCTNPPESGQPFAPTPMAQPAISRENLQAARGENSPSQPQPLSHPPIDPTYNVTGHMLGSYVSGTNSPRTAAPTFEPHQTTSGIFDFNSDSDLTAWPSFTDTSYFPIDHTPVQNIDPALTQPHFAQDLRVAPPSIITSGFPSVQPIPFGQNTPTFAPVDRARRSSYGNHLSPLDAHPMGGSVSPRSDKASEPPSAHPGQRARGFSSSSNASRSPFTMDNSPAASDHTSPRRPHREDPLMNKDGQYVCGEPECFAAFSRKCEWSKHMDKHERPYKCKDPNCFKLEGFTYTGGLLRHEREVHRKHGGPKERLLCTHPGCKRTHGFSRRENLNEHVRRVHHKAYTPTRVKTEESAEISHAPSPRSEASDVAGLTGAKRKRDSVTTPLVDHNGGAETDKEGLKGEIKRLKQENAEQQEQMRRMELRLNELAEKQGIA